MKTCKLFFALIILAAFPTRLLATDALTSAWVSKSGTVIFFGAANPTPSSATGLYQTAPITALAGPYPTVYRNGNAVNLGAPVWFPTSLDTPWVAFRLNCGTIRKIAILDGGEGYTSPPTITWNGDGGGTSLVLGTPVLQSGGVTSYTVNSGGSGYTSATLTIATPPNYNTSPTSPVAAFGRPTLTGGAISSVALSGPGILGCGSGYTSSPTVTVNGNGTGASITANVSSYVYSVPITSQSGSWNSPPTFTVSGGGATRTASVYAVMNGPSSSDVITFTTSANWMTPTISGTNYTVPAQTAATADNWVGRLEGVSGGFATFAQTPKMGAGVNMGSQPSQAYYPTSAAKNLIHGGNGWSSGGTLPGVMTTDKYGTPLSWTNPTSTTWTRWCSGPFASNYIDGMGNPGRPGIWTLKYTDYNANTSKAMWMFLTTNYGSYYNSSGPNVNTSNYASVSSADITYSSGGIHIPSLANSSLGVGYSGAIVSVLGGGGSGCSLTAQVNPVDGSIASITTICPGVGYSSSNPPTIAVSGTTLQGKTVTVLKQMTYPASPSLWAHDAKIAMAAPSTGGIGYFSASDIRIVGPDPYTGNAQPTPSGESPLAVDGGVIKNLTAANGHVPATLRFMDATAGYGGTTDEVNPTDYLLPTSFEYNNQTTYTTHFVAARYINTNPASTVYPWYSGTIYGPQAIFGPSGSFTLPINDNGAVLGSYGASTSSLAVELRTAAPHKFTSGQRVYLQAPTGSVPVTFTNCTGPYTLPSGNGPTSFLFVTSPTTIIIQIYAPSIIKPGQPSLGLAPQTVVSASEIDLTAGGTKPGWQGWTYTLQGNIIPYRAAATQVSAFPGAMYFCNLPVGASDGLIQNIANEVSAGIADTNYVGLEQGNEVWNTRLVSNVQCVPWGHLLSYASTTAPILDGFIGSGSYMPYAQYNAVPLMCYSQNVFENQWVANGLSASRIKRIFSSFFVMGNITQEIVDLCQRSGYKIDYVDIAPYYQIPSDQPIKVAFSPVGTALAGAQGFPPDAINDVFRHWFTYSSTNISYHTAHNQALQAIGQPVRSSGVNYTSGTGSLPPGNYNAAFTYIDSAGLETTAGLSASNWNGITSGNVPTVIFPAAPPWVFKINLYLNYNNGGWQLYQQYLPNQYAFGTAIRLTAAMPGVFASPPTTNFAAKYAPTPPTLICYEGGCMTSIPGGLAYGDLILHDSFADPSYADAVYCWYLSNQVGDPTMTVGGCSMANYFCYLLNMSYNSMWMLAYGPGQTPGAGTSNKYALDDKHDHNGGPIGTANASTPLQGLLNFLNDAPPPTIPSRDVLIRDHRGEVPRRILDRLPEGRKKLLKKTG